MVTKRSWSWSSCDLMLASSLAIELYSSMSMTTVSSQFEYKSLRIASVAESFTPPLMSFTLATRRRINLNKQTNKHVFSIQSWDGRLANTGPSQSQRRIQSTYQTVRIELSISSRRVVFEWGSIQLTWNIEEIYWSTWRVNHYRLWESFGQAGSGPDRPRLEMEWKWNQTTLDYTQNAPRTSRRTAGLCLIDQSLPIWDEFTRRLKRTRLNWNERI